MKKITSLASRLPVIVLLLLGISVLSFTESNKTTRKQDRRIANAAPGSTESYSEEFTYISYEADCSLMAYPGYFPDDTYYVDTDPIYITTGTHIYYDAELIYSAPAGTYFFYHNETAEFVRCIVDSYGEVISIEQCY
jgi:hypothetical protein